MPDAQVVRKRRSPRGRSRPVDEARPLGPARRTAGRVGAVAEGWAEESQAQPARARSEDPISGLATLPYLRAAFPGGETLSMAGPHAGRETGPAIALVPARGDLPLRYARLRRGVRATFGTQIRMTPLPGRLTEALCLVDKLAR